MRSVYGDLIREATRKTATLISNVTTRETEVAVECQHRTLQDHTTAMLAQYRVPFGLETPGSDHSTCSLGEPLFAWRQSRAMLNGVYYVSPLVLIDILGSGAMTMYFLCHGLCESHVKDRHNSQLRNTVQIKRIRRQKLRVPRTGHSRPRGSG